MPSRGKKRVLLVDDHPMVRAGLAQVINQQQDLIVCGEAESAKEAMQLIASNKPDLAVIDISLEGKGGLELTKELKQIHPKLAVLIMSMHDEAIYAERALRAGARGYVMKKAGGEIVLEAIRTILSGKPYVSEKMSDQLLSAVVGRASRRKKSGIEILSEREFEVFRLIGLGQSTRQIGQSLHISPKTVDVHRQHLKEKLRVPNGTVLIQYAVRWVETQA